MADTIGAAVRARAKLLRDNLAGGGIPTSLEPDQVTDGGAWVSVRSMEPLTIGDGWAVRFHVYLVAPAVGSLEALTILTDLLDLALDVLDVDEPINTATAITLPHTPTQPLPAFLLVVDELVEP